MLLPYLNMNSFKLIKRFIIVFLVFTSVKSFSYNFKLDSEDFFGVKTVVIDAGHGGHDGGCQGAHSSEKNVALSIALYAIGFSLPNRLTRLISAIVIYALVNI